jgi:hypothetical protein
MLIDCDTCAARGDACGDCVVSVLLPPPVAAEWDEAERRALAALAAGGLIAWPAPLERPAAARGRSPLPVPLPMPMAGLPVRRAG